MKLSHNNLCYKIFIVDPLRDALPVYDLDDDIAYVMVNKDKEIIVDTRHGTVLLELFEPSNDKEFNDLAIQALLKSCEISNNIVQNMQQARELFGKRDIPIGRVLISKNRRIEDGPNEHQQLFDIWHLNWFYYVEKVDGLADNEMMFVSDPEFLGVIPIQENIKRTHLEDITYELYGIGIINTNGAVLVRSE